MHKHTENKIIKSTAIFDGFHMFEISEIIDANLLCCTDGLRS